MNHGGREWRIEVLAGGDVLRQERLTRMLHDELLKADGLSVGFMDPVTDPGPDPAEIVVGSLKGGSFGDVALWAAIGAAASRPAAQVLVTLIKEWCAKERHRKVELTYRGNPLTIPARPDAAQERIIRDFMDKVGQDTEHTENTDDPE